jgi:hypothetical protein
MIVDKVTITLTNAENDLVMTKVDFEPPLKEDEEVENTPNVLTLAYIIGALENLPTEGKEVNE